MQQQKTALVITSISAPNAVLKACAEGAAAKGHNFIVIGDLKSPENFQLNGCDFYSIARQEQMEFSIAKILPTRHYARKNIGYLLAKDMDVIIETDDDNFPRHDFWFPRERKLSAARVEEKGWLNVYRLFSKENVWPRGFPLEYLQEDLPSAAKFVQGHYDCPIQQGLADENPDVDAVYRMTMKLPLSFDQRDPLVLGSGVWCPFNSQNTTWFQEAYPLLYLPSYCSFRMTDIWRSFVAQRIAWTCDWHLMFHQSTVWQERNAHNLLKDFEDEIPGYLHNHKIVQLLESLDLRYGVAHLVENLIRCYKALCDKGMIGQQEMALVEAWLYDLKK